jgi:hypothetical protein
MKGGQDTSVFWLALPILGTMFWLRPAHDWQGFVYPDSSNLATHVSIGSFTSFEACQQSAIDTLRVFDRAASGDYECGKGCKPNGRGLNVCDETRK